MNDVDAEVLAGLRERACAVVAGFSPELPPYAQLPSALSEAEFAHGTRRNVELFFDFLASGELPSCEATAEVVELALTRVREGVPLEGILSRYRIAARYMVCELERSATAAERAVIAATGPRLMEFVAAVTARVAVACVEHVSDPLWEQRDRKRAVADALLEGRDPLLWAQDGALPLAKSYLVAVFELAPGADPAQVTRLRNDLDRTAGAFVRMDSAGWTALLPLIGGDEVVASMQRLIDGAGEQDSVPQLWVGVAQAARRGDIPAAAREARTVCDICRRTGRAATVTEVPAVLLEFVLTGGPAARPHLRPIIEVLDGQPALAQTLDAYIACQFNQLATARRLGVHRNTVTYRLASIAEATGWDPLQPRAAMVLYAARLTAPDTV